MSTEAVGLGGNVTGVPQPEACAVESWTQDISLKKQLQD